MSDIVIYKTENGAVSVKLAQETVWLSQAQMIALFDRDQSVISRHIRNVFNPDCSLGVESSQNQGVVGRVLTRHIGLKPDLRPNGLSGFNESELPEESNMQKMHSANSDKISVGSRVKSIRGGL